MGLGAGIRDVWAQAFEMLGRRRSRRLGAGVRDAWTRAALSEGPLIAILPAAGRGSATALLRRVAQVDGAFNRARLLQQLPASAVLRDDAQRVGAVLQRRGDDEDHLRGVVDGQLRDAGLLPVGGNEVDAHGLVRALDLDVLARDGVDGAGLRDVALGARGHVLARGDEGGGGPLAHDVDVHLALEHVAQFLRGLHVGVEGVGGGVPGSALHQPAAGERGVATNPHTARTPTHTPCTHQPQSIHRRCRCAATRRLSIVGPLRGPRYEQIRAVYAPHTSRTARGPQRDGVRTNTCGLRPAYLPNGAGTPTGSNIA